MANGTEKNITDKNAVLEKIKESNPSLDMDIIGKAYDYCDNAHKGQKRASGDPYIHHPIEVAKIAASYHLDTTTVVASLLHDVVEDTPISLKDIEKEFGKDVAFLVDGVTKITSLQMPDKEQQQAETFRKMLLSMAKDIRVILIKFIDRLHNIRTLHFLSPERIKKIASETMDIYAPLAHRLGMANIKSEFEDISFKYLYPEQYKKLSIKVKETLKNRELYVKERIKAIEKILAEENITGEVSGRSKHLYSIHRKMKQGGFAFDEIYDLFAIRIVTNSIKDCYIALGMVHSLWSPLPSRLKDYIASPKSNMYQSLHTAVICSDGKMLEIQIRTTDMHKTAESGIAAHWMYKEGGKFSASQEHIEWLKQIEEWQKELSDSKEFMEFLKIDLFPAEIFVFSPKGDISQLPKGSTALDFAFSIHTDLGLHCVGCKINNSVMPVDTILKSGSTVEILRSETQKPSMEWLRYVRTSKAKSALKKWLNQEGKIQSIDLGNEIILREFQKLNLQIDYKDWLKLATKTQNIESTDNLLEMIGKGILSSYKVIHSTPTENIKQKLIPNISNMVNKIKKGTGTSPILIKDNKNLLIRIAKCCRPVPGEKIIGFITKGRGVAVHSLNCPNAVLLSSEKERCVPVEWNKDSCLDFTVRLVVIAKNRLSLLSDIVNVISNNGLNILNANLSTHQEIAKDVFLIEVSHIKQLKKLIPSIKKIDGVQKAYREIL